MRIVVTGCGGYIGSSLIRRLKHEGHCVIGLDRRESDSRFLDHFVQCDLRDVGEYSNLLGGADMVCHLAAARGDWGISTREYYRDNVEATRSLLGAVAKAEVAYLMFYSTVSVLGPSYWGLSEDAPFGAINAYGASKAECEQLFAEYAEEVSGAQVITVRPSVVFGPENPTDTNIFRLIDAVYNRRFLMVGKGDWIKTTSYLDNLIDAHMFLMARIKQEKCRSYEIYHYIDEPRLSTWEIVEQIYEALGREPVKWVLPLRLATVFAKLGDAVAGIAGVDFPITTARIRKFCTSTNFCADAIRGLGFRQRISNEEAIERTVGWYRTAFETRG